MNQMQNQHGISTQQQTEDEPNQFQTVNSIYELQSIINQLSIQKQKNWISYTMAVKEQDQIIQNYSSTMAQLEERIKEQEVCIGELEEIVEKEKDRYRRVLAEKEGLVKLMDTDAGVPGGQFSVYFVVVDYKRMKKELADKNQYIDRLQQQMLTKQMKLNQSTLQTNYLKKTLTTQLQNLHQKLHQSQKTHLSKTTLLLTQLQQQQNNHKSHSQQQQKHINELEQQIVINLGQIKQYRKNLQEIKNAYNNHQYLQVEDVRKQARSMELVLKNKYDGLLAMYEGLLQEKMVLARDKNTVDNQLNYYKSSCQKYQLQLQALKTQITTSKQVINKMGKQIIDLELQNSVRKVPNDNLVKLEELSYQYNKDRKKFMGEIAELVKSNNNLSNTVEEKQKQILLLQERNRQRNKFIQNLQKNNRNLSQQLLTSTTTNNTLKQSNQNLQNLQSQTELKLKQLQILTTKSSKQDNPNIIYIESDKYTVMMNTLINIRKQNDGLIKENIMLKEYVGRIQGEIVGKSRDGCQKEYEIFQLRGRLEVANGEIEEYRHKIHKLENSLEHINKQNNEDRNKLLNKIQILKECVSRLEKLNEQYQNNSIINKPKQLAILSKTIDIKIQASFPELRVQTKSSSKQQQNLSDKNQIHQIQSVEYLAVPSLKTHSSRMRALSDLNPDIKIQNKLVKKQLKPLCKTDRDEENLDKIIKELKNQNKSLTVSYMRTDR